MSRKSLGLFLRGRRWYLKYRDLGGAWKEHATGLTNYHDALEARDTFLGELKKGITPGRRAKWTLAQAVAAWLTDRGLRVARSTFQSERTITRNLLRVLGGEIKLVELCDPHRIRYYVSSRLAQGINPKTVNNEVQVLAAILQEANLWHRIGANYKPLRVPKHDVGAALSREEGRRLVQFAMTASEFAVAAFVAVLAYATGLRSKELKQLQLGVIHLDGANPHLYVKRQTTKSDRGARYVALDSLARWALRKLINRARNLGAYMPEHFLLPTLLEKHTRKSDPLHGGSGFDVTNPQSSWGAEWRDLRRIVRIEHLRFHDLRHSYITRAAEAGVALAVIQAQVGHMSTQMVEHYTHICQGAIHHAARQIENASLDLMAILGLSPNNQPGAYPESIDKGNC
jgi:integrase